MAGRRPLPHEAHSVDAAECQLGPLRAAEVAASQPAAASAAANAEECVEHAPGVPPGPEQLGPSGHETSYWAPAAGTASGDEYIFDTALMEVEADQLRHTKQEMRRRLAFLSSCYPLARPSQGLLKQVTLG